MTYEDSLEFMGYSESSRHPIEILGFEYSTQGMKYFQSNKPDIIQILGSVIIQTVNNFGTYPSEISAQLRKSGSYIFTDENGDIIYSSPDDKRSYLQFERFDTKCKSVDEAAFKLMKRKVQPEYL
jgi:hypothetical protein